MAGTNGNGNGNGAPKVGTDTVKQGLAQMLKGGVIVSWPTSDGFIRFVGGFERHELELSTICRKRSGIMADMCLRRIFRACKAKDEDSKDCSRRSVHPVASCVFCISCVRLAGPVSLAGLKEIGGISYDDVG